MEETNNYIARYLLESTEEVVEINLVMRPAPEWVLAGLKRIIETRTANERYIESLHLLNRGEVEVQDVYAPRAAIDCLKSMFGLQHFEVFM